MSTVLTTVSTVDSLVGAEKVERDSAARRGIVGGAPGTSEAGDARLGRSLTPASSYAETVTLIGQVIALHATRIARERSRARPDRAAITALERQRETAVQTCRTLNTVTPAALEEIRDTYARLFLDLATRPVLDPCAAALGSSLRPRPG